MRTKTPDPEWFGAGAVAGRYNGHVGPINCVPSGRLSVQYPVRVNAMAIDPAQIDIRSDRIYSAGEVVISLALTRTVEASLTPFEPAGLHPRQALLDHGSSLVAQAAGHRTPIYVQMIDDQAAFPHAGLGSSSGTIAAAAAATNELLGRPLAADPLIRYLAQNHGEEESPGSQWLRPVQCLGGAAAAGHLRGSVQVLAGHATCIASIETEPGLRVVLGMPRSYEEIGAEQAMAAEEQALPEFVATGEKWAARIAYRMLHEAIPAMRLGDLRPLGSLVTDYRFDMGSIRNCSFLYPEILDIAKELSPMRRSSDHLAIGISSVGPAFFALTTDPEGAATSFSAGGLKVIASTGTMPGTYDVL